MFPIRMSYGTTTFKLEKSIIIHVFYHHCVSGQLIPGIMYTYSSILSGENWPKTMLTDQELFQFPADIVNYMYIADNQYFILVDIFNLRFLMKIGTTLFIQYI